MSKKIRRAQPYLPFFDDLISIYWRLMDPVGMKKKPRLGRLPKRLRGKTTREAKGPATKVDPLEGGP